MNHRWEKIEEFKPETEYEFQRKELEKSKCKICGCIRTTVKYSFERWPHMEYDRSGTAHWENYAPECIDWNDNTLD